MKEKKTFLKIISLPKSRFENFYEGGTYVYKKNRDKLLCPRVFFSPFFFIFIIFIFYIYTFFFYLNIIPEKITQVFITKTPDVVVNYKRFLFARVLLLFACKRIFCSHEFRIRNKSAWLFCSQETKNQICVD